MEKNEILRYIEKNGRLSVPEAQIEFSAGYEETRRIFEELERESEIKADGDLYFVLNNEYGANGAVLNAKLKKIKKETEIMPENFKDILRFCSEQKTITASIIQRQFDTGYSRSAKIIDRLAEIGAVLKKGRECEVLITPEDYSAMFGEPENDDISDEEIKNAEVVSLDDYLENLKKNAETMEKLQSDDRYKFKSVFDDDDDESDDDDAENGDDKTDDVCEETGDDKMAESKKHFDVAVLEASVEIIKKTNSLSEAITVSVEKRIAAESYVEKIIYKQVTEKMKELTEDEFKELKKMTEEDDA